ncbi:MAG: DUF1232 domain-containing protein [Pseudomonadales bacterium]|nr:DUF1232 domain-containing protein [Pseudomonadales bacterium]
MIIGILKADSVREEFQPEFGDYPDMFRNLISGAANSPIEFRTWDVVKGEYPDRPGECDAYLITGSKTSVYDDEPWVHRLRDYVVELHEARVKLIGICYGHQMVAHALGGIAESAEVGWGVGVHESGVVRTDDFMDPPLQSFSLLVSHQDQVTKLPENATLLARSDFCPFSMFRIEDHILAFQGHPEFCKGYSKALMEMREEILGEEKFTTGMASLTLQTDEEVIARWILNFIEKEDYRDAPRGFEAARRQAGEILKDERRTSELLDKAAAKADRKKGALGEAWNDLRRLFRLLSAWSSGEYRGVRWQTILLVTTAILYFVMPFDVIPDFLAIIGLLDDATIIGFVAAKIRDELQAFSEWEDSTD